MRLGARRPVPTWDSLESPDPNKLWADYDSDTDSFILYTTGKPEKGIHVLLDDDIYVIVNPATKQAIGLYVEGWEKRFVPVHAEVRALWERMKPTESAWLSLLRMIALWIAVSLAQQAEEGSVGLQPA